MNTIIRSGNGFVYEYKWDEPLPKMTSDIGEATLFTIEEAEKIVKVMEASGLEAEIVNINNLLSINPTQIDYVEMLRLLTKEFPVSVGRHNLTTDTDGNPVVTIVNNDGKHVSIVIKGTVDEETTQSLFEEIASAYRKERISNIERV